METKISLPYSQLPVTCPRPEPDQSSTRLPSCFTKIHSDTIFPSMQKFLYFRYYSDFVPMQIPAIITDISELIFI